MIFEPRVSRETKSAFVFVTNTSVSDIRVVGANPASIDNPDETSKRRSNDYRPAITTPINLSTAISCVKEKAP